MITAIRKTPIRRRGMALVGAMLVMLMILTMLLLGALANGRATDEAGGLAGHSDNVMWSGRRRAYALAAQSLAESGARLLVEWLNNGSAINSVLQAGPPSLAGTSFYGATQVGNYDEISTSFGGSTGKMRVRLYPYTKNATNNRRLFVAESVGEYMGITQIIRVVITEKTFARYAMFCDTCPANWWVQDNTFFNGPVHINGINSAGTAVDSSAVLNILWKSTSTQKIFGYNGADSFTTSMASNQIQWNKNVAGTVTAPTGTQWNNIMGTNAAPLTGQPVVKMPTQSGKQYTAALAGTSEPSTTTGVKIPSSGGQTTGGVFIKGPVDRIKLSASGTDSTVQGMEIYQSEGLVQTRTIVTINRATNTTTIQKDTRATSLLPWVTGTATSLNGTTNGVVYSTGDVAGLSGVVANNVMSGTDVSKTNDLTIVTDADKKISLDGGVVYANLASDLSDANNPKSNSAAATTQSGTLGLVARNIQIKQYTPSGAALTDMSLHATIMAYDTFDAENPRSSTDASGNTVAGRAAGNFKLLGGYIAKNNGTFGQVDANSNLLAGFRVNRNYDQRAADNPPPFFPSEENSFQVTSFQRVPNTLQ
ncbi:MAG: hypothetical protein QM758_21125 [Armatimonas sp.]